MNIKSNLLLLAEAATADMKIHTKNTYALDSVREAYAKIPESPEMVVTEAADVVITETAENEFFVEMSNLAPFMMDSGITNIAEALDMVAAANGLEPKALGLCIESQVSVDAMLEAAKKKSEATKSDKPLKSAMAKVDKNNKAAASLMKKGYKVVKKSNSSKVCPKCGKANCKCECDMSGNKPGMA